jgi:hypothetical protein
MIINQILIKECSKECSNNQTEAPGARIDLTSERKFKGWGAGRILHNDRFKNRIRSATLEAALGSMAVRKIKAEVLKCKAWNV